MKSMRLNRQNVYVRMVRQRMNQRNLSQASGVSQQTISKVLNGANCAPETLYKLSTALHADPVTLMVIDSEEDQDREAKAV